MNKAIHLLLLSLLWCVTGNAQPYCELSVYTVRDGLAANKISAITQDINGVMWFGTWNGLSYYDGYQFFSIRNELSGSQGITTNRIKSLKKSATGNLWCVTPDHRAYLFNTSTCGFTDVNQLIVERYQHHPKVRNVYPLDNGYTWVVDADCGNSYRVRDDSLQYPEAMRPCPVPAQVGKGRHLKKVMLDNDGREWVFYQGGLKLYGSKHHLKGNYEYLLQQGDNVLLATLQGKMMIYNIASDRFTELLLPNGVERINDMVALNDRQILVATEKGIAQVEILSRKVSMHSVQTPEQPFAEVRKLFVDSRQRVWIFTDSPGVQMLTPGTNIPKWMNTPDTADPSYSRSRVPFFHQDRQEVVWLIPHKGVFAYYDEATGRLVSYRLVTSTHQVTDVSELNRVFVDREKNVWFTSFRDVNCINFKYHQFHCQRLPRNDEVRSVMTDSRKCTWVGTNLGALMVYDDSHQLLGYVNPQGVIASQYTRFAQRIYALYQDKKGRVWVGTKGDGLYVIDEKNKVLHYRMDASNPYSLSFDDVYCVKADERGRIWIATYGGGVNYVEEGASGKLRFIHAGNRLATYPLDEFSQVRSVTPDGKGNLYLSTTNGLITLSTAFGNPKDIRFYVTRQNKGQAEHLLTADVLQTMVTKSGQVYILTLGGSVQRMNSPSPLKDSLTFTTLSQFNTDEGRVQAVVEDRQGFLWMIRENSINRYQPVTDEVLCYGPGVIGEEVELTESLPVYNAADNTIVVAGHGCFLSFCPDKVKLSDYKPSIAFTGVQYQGEVKRHSIINVKEVEIPADKRNLTIFFSALEYADKFMVQYAYKLDGVDDKWNYVGTVNSASFNRLPAGHHRLLVKSSNCDGVMQDNITALNLYVHPTFWETPWAVVLYVLMGIAVVVLAIYIYKLKTKAEMEQELNEMKTKFFTEISHKLRTPLTLIGGPVTEILDKEELGRHVKSQLEMVQRNTSQMLELVNKMLHYGKADDVYINDDSVPDNLPAVQTEEQPATDGKDKLLIVEDNDDLRDFLVSILRTDFHVLMASNGQQGLEIAQGMMPDFIITDVMMPVMDGLTMVHQIKQNKDICHIPIIVLSAKASLEDRLQGLKEGIDDYITKPFSALYLKLRVRNIIAQRHMLQQSYVEQLKPDNDETYQLDSPQIVDADREMMQKLMEFLETRISDASLRIEDLADAVHLGRSVFYGKIKSIVGMTPVDFLRHIRMQRAGELIRRSNYSFSQIAYEVGYSDPKYFSKCFKKETGMSPSEYREKCPEKNADTFVGS
ncbi:MAG: two-component regulator propeller domain-containing protein [Prevotella sp.]